METWWLILLSLILGVIIFVLIFNYPKIRQFLKTLWKPQLIWQILKRVVKVPKLAQLLKFIWEVLRIWKLMALEKKKKKLQTDIGEKPIVEIDKFENWARTRTIQNLLVVKPRCLTEVQAVVKAAVKNKLRVRCAGAKHSWSPMFPDEGNILMYNLDIQRHDGPRIELIKNEDGAHKVNVMSGVSVGELMEFELKNKITLPCNVILKSPTYGGVVSLGCHGVGWNCQGISDYCTQMRIVDASGELRTFRKEDDLDMMLAVQCNLGMFGIIYDMQLLVWEETIAHVHDNFNYNAEDLFYNAEKLKEMVTTTDSVEIFHFPFNSVGWSEVVEEIKGVIGEKETLTREEWDPKNDQLYIRQIKFNTPEEAKGKKLEPDSYYKSLDVQTWYSGKATEVIDFLLVNFAKQVTPLVCKTGYCYLRETTEGTRWQPLPNAIHYRPNIHLITVRDMAFCINVQDDFSNVTQACQTILELVRQEGEKGRFPLNIALEMRWMKYSEAYLCPAIVGSPSEGGSGHTFYIEIISFADTPNWQEFANKVALKLLKIKGVQFHWAKEWEYVDGVVEYIQTTNAERIKKFKSALARSGCDPDGVFLNKKLQEIFFPER